MSQNRSFTTLGSYTVGNRNASGYTWPEAHLGFRAAMNNSLPLTIQITAQALTSTTGLKDLASGEWVRPRADVLHLTLNPNVAIAQSTPTINASGMVELIKEFEGFHPKPY